MNKDIEQVGFEEKYFDTGEVKLHYLVGPNNGLPLVLIPAQGLSLESYQRVLVPLSKDFQVFAVDVRGHGKSSWTTGNYNFPNMGKDFKKLLEKSCWKELRNIPLVVTSFRIKTQAIALKFKKYFLAKNASHDVIIETLEKNKELLCQLKRK